MAQSIRDVMTQNPECVSGDTTVADAAKLMRDKDFGGVLCLDGDQVSGFLTDRDIAVRVVAEGKDPTSTKVSEAATTDLHTLSPDDSVEDAIKLVREHNIRRVPVVDFRLDQRVQGGCALALPVLVCEVLVVADDGQPAERHPADQEPAVLTPPLAQALDLFLI